MMTDREYNEYVAKVRRGLDLSVERCLREKAMLRRDVVLSRPDGRVFTMPAAAALEMYMRDKQADR